MELASHSAGRNRARLLLVFALATFSIFASTSQAIGFFAPATNFAAGDGPQSVAIGNLNGDGFSDLAVANINSNNVSILLGNGDGSFGAATNFAAGTSPRSVAIGKLNGDGFPDLAVANVGSNNVSILLGNGDGSFGAATNFAAGTSPNSVAIGNLDNDTVPDLAVANKFSDNVSVLLGTGTGAFGVATNFAAGSNPTSVAIGNLNAGGIADLAVTNSGSNNVSVLLGTGTGSFAAATSFAVGNQPQSIAIGDLNGDGFADFATANSFPATVSVVLGTGTGSFGTATNYAAGNPFSVAIGNLNGDGIPDLAVANLGPGNVSILLGTGAGSFSAGGNYAVGTFPGSVAIGNLNADSLPDLATANNLTHNVSVLLNSPPTAGANPAGLSFASQVQGSTSAAQTVTVTNVSGGGPLLVRGITLTGANAGDFALPGDNCSSNPLPPSGTCGVGVTFTPSASGTRNASLEVSYVGVSSPLTVPLSGIGVGTTPPDTVIDSGPNGTITVNQATFTFSGVPAVDTAKIQCKIDGAAYADCTSPKTFSGLADGSHTASFRAEDAAGNPDQSPASRTFTVDTTIQRAKINKVTVSGPSKVKKGKKATYKVKISNSGNAEATGVRLKVSGRGVSFNTSVGKIAAGKTRTVKVRIKPKQPVKIKATFKVTSSNAGSKFVKKTIKVKK